MSPVVVHLDESCLGNGREGHNPGGAGGLIEARGRSGRIERRDIYLHEPATTNNRMALRGATETLRLLSRKGARLRVLVFSDSEYLVKGMREWVPGWIARGWKRKGGAVENLELWQALVAAARLHEVSRAWEELRGRWVDQGQASDVQGDAEQFVLRVDAFVSAIEAQIAQWITLLHAFQLALVGMAIGTAVILFYAGYRLVRR